MKPLAGIVSSLLAVMIRSGVPMVHFVSGKVGVEGAEVRSPGLAPVAAQSMSTWRSASVIVRAFLNSPNFGCACHGGIWRVPTTSARALALAEADLKSA